MLKSALIRRWQCQGQNMMGCPNVCRNYSTLHTTANMILPDSNLSGREYFRLKQVANLKALEKTSISSFSALKQLSARTAQSLGRLWTRADYSGRNLYPNLNPWSSKNEKKKKKRILPTAERRFNGRLLMSHLIRISVAFPLSRYSPGKNVKFGVLSHKSTLFFFLVLFVSLHNNAHKKISK